MLRASMTFFAIGVLALLLGIFDVAGVSFETGRMVLFGGIGLAIVTFIASLLTRNRRVLT